MKIYNLIRQAYVCRMRNSSTFEKVCQACFNFYPMHQLLKDKVRFFRRYLERTQDTVFVHLGEDRIEEVWFNWWKDVNRILEDWVANSMFAFNIKDKALRSSEEFQSFVRQNSVVEVSRKVEEVMLRLRLVLDCIWLFEGENLRSFYSDDVVRVSQFTVSVYDGYDGVSSESDEPLSDLDESDK